MLQPKNYRIPEQCLCDICKEAIIDPICPTCITTEIEAWLVLYPNLRKELMPKLKEFINKIQDRFNATKCIQCKNKSASVCPYCFTNYVLKHLKEINSNKIVLTEFFHFFNFDFHKTKSTKGDEALSLI